ncbi:MAG: response regulator [Planctomycetales bacterium]|nr:response regulator [Planctomycetales bacterium]
MKDDAYFSEEPMMRVLLVDDSKFVVKSLQTILEQLGFEVVGMASDGHEALAQFQEHHPDVTLLDVTMPNMDGVECLSRIKELDADAPVVMLSAIQDPDTIDKCLQLGAASFLKKPIKKTSPADLSRLSCTLEEAAAKVV